MAGSSSANIALSFSPSRRSSLKMSATNLSYGELLVEILSWLPVDSLLRFRFVCKSWFNLVTHDSRLVKLQLLHHHSLQFDKCYPTILFNKQTYERIYSLSLKMDDNKLIDPSQGSELIHSFEKLNPRKKDHPNVCTLEFVGSCNGLVCIRVYNCYAGYHCIAESIIYIWNPSTKEFKRIPDSPVECPVNSDDGPPSRFTYGFGCDRTIDDYKVIRYVQDPNIADSYFEPCEYGSDAFNEAGPREREYHDLGSEIKVYTLGTNSWRRIHQQIPYVITDCRLNGSKPAAAGLLVNGSLHWVTSCSLRFDRIISFDIVDEEYREVPKPDNLDHGGDVYVELQELGGCLCLYYQTHRYHPVQPPALCIWIMMDYGVKESWTKLFTINLSPFRINHNHPMFIHYNRYITPLWLFKNGKILIGMCNKDLVLCSPESNEIEFLMNTKIPDFERSKISYIPSLVSLKSGTCTNQTQVKQNEEDPEQTKGREDDREQTNN